VSSDVTSKFDILACAGEVACDSAAFEVEFLTFLGRSGEMAKVDGAELDFEIVDEGKERVFGFGILLGRVKGAQLFEEIS